MKHCLTILIFSLTLAHAWGQKQEELLLQAYRSHSAEKLEIFFDQWMQETPALSPDVIGKSDDTVRNVYLLFERFYNPIDIQRIGGSEWGNDIYKKATYFLLQDKVRFAFVDTLDKDILLQKEYARLAKVSNISVDSVIRHAKADRNSTIERFIEWPAPKQYETIENFRPRVSFQKPKTIVLIDEYDSILNRFLGSSHYPLGHGNIMSPAASSGESANRQKFLGQCIKIWYGHWGGYWQLHTYPTVNSIVFDKSLTHALIYYRMVYEGGYAYFKKMGGIWTLVEAKRTWIE
jgi:hypothetical protein